MHVFAPLLLGLSLLRGDGEATPPRGPDLAHLQEMLHDRRNAQAQSQAALLMVENTSQEAEKAVRQGLRKVENVEVFLALAAAVRLRQDRRFLDELLAALSAGQSSVRDTAAQSLAVLADDQLVTRLRRLAADVEEDTSVRQAALRTLGRCGSKQAAAALLDHLRTDGEALRRAAAAALHDLSGQDYGVDGARWLDWWKRHKQSNDEHWLAMRLAYQSSRAHRLDGDLMRSRARVLRLEQQLYSRLSAAERVSHIQSLHRQDDPAVRGLAVSWSVELLPTAEADHKRLLTQVLLRLSHDSAVEVRRAAVLGLGRIAEPAVFARLLRLAHADVAAVRTAALHALAMHAHIPTNSPPERRESDKKNALARRKQVMPLLQKALDDPVLEVLVEAAEDLGELGALEAGPVLTGLLRHSSETVRQTAAQALERVAEVSVLPVLLKALDDPSAAVRFNLVGALAHIAGDGSELSEQQRSKVAARLEKLLLRDSDPGVRSRAATVLGQCAAPAQLAMLWHCVLAGEDGRVQEKAWSAFLDILTRAGRLPLLREWDRTLTAARQGPRRLQMLTNVVTRWHNQPEHKDLVLPAQEMLARAQVELGKWSAAAPLVRELLGRPAASAELNRRLAWMLTIGEQALHEGNRIEALRAVEAAQPFLPRKGKLTDSFEKLRKKAARKE